MKMQHTRDQLAKMYGIGVVVFAVIFGFITVFAIFLGKLNFV